MSICCRGSIIQLYQDDTKPRIAFQIQNDNDSTPIDLSAVGTTVKGRFRPRDVDATKAEIGCSILGDGSAGQCALVSWPSGLLAGCSTGRYEMQILTDVGGNGQQTVNGKIDFNVNESFSSA